MKLKCKNTARLAVTAGLCASMALTGLPIDAIAEELVSASESSISATDVAVVSTAPAAVSAEQPAAEESATYDGYAVDEQGNVEISNASGLKHLAEVVNGGNSLQGKTVRLASDIDLNNEAWEPIGNTDARSFNGVFDGAGHVISNLLVKGAVDTSASNANHGLFGCTANGEIKDLTVTNARVTGGLGVGAIVGRPYTSKMTNLTLAGDVQVSGYAYVGGMLGRNAYADLTNLKVDVKPGSRVDAQSKDSMTYVGGVVGFMGEGGIKVTNATSNINVYGSTAGIGGISGNIHYGNTFTDCSVSGDAKVKMTAANPEYHPFDTMQIGGIAGLWVNSNDADCRISGCSFDGSLSATSRTGEDYTSFIAGNDIAGGLWQPGENGSGSLTIVDGNATTVVPGGAKEAQDIFSNIKDGSTIKLSCDVTANVVIPEGVSVTIDLNGFTLSGGTVSGKAAITNNGAVVIRDSSAAGTGRIIREDNGTPSYYVIDNEGTMTIESGTVYNNAGDYKVGSSLICNGGKKTAVLNIKGGTLEQEKFIVVKNDDYGTLNMTGGVIKTSAGKEIDGKVYTPSGVQNWGQATLTGGVVNGAIWTSSWSDDLAAPKTVISGDFELNGDVVVKRAEAYPGGAAPEVSIEGGSLNVTEWNIQEDDAEIKVSGGTFEGEPPADEYIVPGSGLQKDENGNYVTVDAKLVFADAVQGGVYVHDVKGDAKPVTEADLLALVGMNVEDSGYTVVVDGAQLAELNRAIGAKDTSREFFFEFGAEKDGVSDSKVEPLVLTVRLVDTTAAPDPVEKVTVTFDDGIGGKTQVTVKPGELLAEPKAPVRDGWRFVGWFKVKVADGTLSEQWDFSKDVATADMTLYGGWVKADEAGKPEKKPTNKLPQTGDMAMMSVMALGSAGTAALAWASDKRRKAK